jgi:hypothetical protein
VGNLWAPIGLGMSWSIFCNGVFLVSMSMRLDFTYVLAVTVDTMFARRQYVPPVLDTAQVDPQNSALFYIGQHVSATSLAWETD